ncbi:hypothetical protein BKA93DRAFT_753051 [Sparassis latifolia]
MFLRYCAPSFVHPYSTPETPRLAPGFLLFISLLYLSSTRHNPTVPDPPVSPSYFHNGAALANLPEGLAKCRRDEVVQWSHPHSARRRSTLSPAQRSVALSLSRCRSRGVPARLRVRQVTRPRPARRPMASSSAAVHERFKSRALLDTMYEHHVASRYSLTTATARVPQLAERAVDTPTYLEHGLPCLSVSAIRQSARSIYFVLGPTWASGGLRGELAQSDGARTGYYSEVVISMPARVSELGLECLNFRAGKCYSVTHLLTIHHATVTKLRHRRLLVRFSTQKAQIGTTS